MTSRDAAHWKRLGLLPGAPECVIKAAHRAQIEIHHPDRGGDDGTARQINVAYDELKGRGSEANVYVAANYGGEPWAVLGLSSAADATLIDRAARLLTAELKTHPRLSARVKWAVEHFGEARDRPGRRERVAPLTPPRPRPRTSARQPAPAGPAVPGTPDGLPSKIDLGTVEWGADATKTFQLTWNRHAPYGVTVDVPPPLRADVTASKVLPGRFSVTVAIDWTSTEFQRTPTTRGYTIDVTVRLRWTSDAEAALKVKAVVLYPAVVSASPPALDLGTVTAQQPVRASLVLVSTGPAAVSVDAPPWLRRVDGAGRSLEGGIKLATNVPVRLEFRVDWAPIVERAEASFAAKRPVRPTGRITVRWNEQSIEVPAELVVNPRRG